MSAYQVGKLLHDMQRNPQLATEFREAREAVLARYDLTEKEKQAILAGDVRFLFEEGVHCMVLISGSRLLGLDIEQFAAALRPLAAA